MLRFLAHRSALAVLLAVLAAVLWWLVGFLPWMIAGFRWSVLPGSSAAVAAGGAVGHRMPVPLLADQLPLLLACALLGGVLAGLTPILFVKLNRWFAVGLVLLVVTAEVVVTAYLSARVVRHAARADFAGDRRVLLGLCLLLALAAGVGLLAGLASVLRHGFVAVAAALVAAALVGWLPGFLLGQEAVPSPLERTTTAVDVLTAVVLGLGLAVSVHRTAWSALWWPMALAIVWCARPAYAATGALAGRLRPGAGLPGSLPGLLGDSGAVFDDALHREHQALWPLVVAVLGGLVGLVWSGRRRRRGNLTNATVDSRREDPGADWIWGDESGVRDESPDGS